MRRKEKKLYYGQLKTSVSQRVPASSIDYYFFSPRNATHRAARVKTIDR